THRDHFRQMQEYLLSLLILTPLAGAFIALCIPSGSERVFRIVALISGSIQLLVLIQLITQYSPSESLQFVEQRPWITLDLGSWGTLKAQYFIAIDGLNILLVCLGVVV